MIVNSVFESMTEALCQGDRIEIRGFGSFVVKNRQAREGRNPRTGELVAVASKAVPFFKADKIRAIGVAERQRVAGFPDIPAVAETLPGYEVTIWYGMMAPAGTPEAIVNRLNSEINKIVNAPDVKATWAKQGAVAMSMTAPAFTKYVAEDVAKWATIVKVSGAKAD